MLDVSTEIDLVNELPYMYHRTFIRICQCKTNFLRWYFSTGSLNLRDHLLPSPLQYY